MGVTEPISFHISWMNKVALHPATALNILTILSIRNGPGMEQNQMKLQIDSSALSAFHSISNTPHIFGLSIDLHKACQEQLSHRLLSSLRFEYNAFNKYLNAHDIATF